MSFAANTVESILKLLDALAPFSLAEEWDNVGLLAGDPNASVTGILVGLDPTPSLLDEAMAHGANLVITHHPIIFPSLTAVRTDQPAGALIATALINKIALIACHTNLDVVPQGVSHALSRRLGLVDPRPLTGSKAGGADIGFGTIGALAEPVSGAGFIQKVAKALNLSAVAVAGPVPATVTQVAVCGGSGSDLAMAAQAQGAQVFVTAEVKHHIGRWAEAAGFCVIDAGHFPTESPITESLAATLASHLAGQGISTPVFVTETQNNPFSFFLRENDQ